MTLKEYIESKGYNWTEENILEQYKRYKNGSYVSYTARDVIQNYIIPTEQSIVSEYYRDRYKVDPKPCKMMSEEDVIKLLQDAEEELETMRSKGVSFIGLIEVKINVLKRVLCK